MTTTRYTTASGSIYEVRSLGPGARKHVRRAKLGDHHTQHGPKQVAKRNSDALGSGEWIPAREVIHHGANFPLVINFDDADKDLVTAPVVKIEVLQ